MTLVGQHMILSKQRLFLLKSTKKQKVPGKQKPTGARINASLSLMYSCHQFSLSQVGTQTDNYYLNTI